MTGPAPGWPPVPPDSDFPLTNLPFGVGAPPGERPRVVAALGDSAIDLAALTFRNRLDGTIPDPFEVFASSKLDRFLAAGPQAWSAVRTRLQELVTDPAARIDVEPALIPRDKLALLLPFTVADYVDFYSSLDHAETVGRLFRPDAEPIPRNWRWQPVGYHGRAGTVMVSGTPVVRPTGQYLEADEGTAPTAPVVGPTSQLDFEAEVAFVVGVPSRQGDRVPADEFRELVFGVVLLNDWSARDIQSWESRPLGPFLGKSFATTISPWVVPLAALEAARVAPPRQEPSPPAYLQCTDSWSLDLQLSVEVAGTVVSRPPFRTMYWTMPQQLAHATSNGAVVRTGDLFASGTVSGPGPDERGCLLELTERGRRTLTLDDGSSLGYLRDGDRVVIRATAPGADGTRIGFGECTGMVTPARH